MNGPGKAIVRLVSSAAFLLLPLSAWAATVSAVPDAGQGTVAVMLNTEDEDINASEGTLRYDGRLVTIVFVEDAHSVIPLWIERPEVSPDCNGQCEIRWSGVIPGGFSGRSGTLFTLRVSPRSTGTAHFSFANVRALKNDGTGSPAEITVRDANLELGSLPPEPVVTTTADIIPPEPFDSWLVRDPTVAEGRWFVVFASRDGESGIDHYEVKEGNGPWSQATSPHLLTDQGPPQVTVRAFDRAGNVREATARISPGAPAPKLRVIGNTGVVAVIGAIAIIALAAALFFRRRR